MVFEEVKKIMIDVMGLSEEEVQLDSHLYDELDADSLDISQIVLALDNKYKIDIEESEILKFKTVEDIVKCVEGQIK
ncbi:acyl carrier protein [Herbivorax sp. ANBcel31]|uniref:acyl carrier protein n=1 Tax=Herbivorax sp. ANBcel31 TaxID=3069754 RepID=UPI0027B1F8B6|nr:acyl carrier protein [Herbivorax sp. ANBcel31]MDQ2085324.1 acyl carrier protein [Herbivorax sp. ANBcel31]